MSTSRIDMHTLEFPSGQSAPSPAPPDRGALLTPAQVASIVGGVSEAWVRRTVPHKLALGHSTVRWYERDVRAWLEHSRATVEPGR
jgi:predicted DNA-binding transcriptional regulator AlpA